MLAQLGPEKREACIVADGGSCLVGNTTVTPDCLLNASSTLITTYCTSHRRWRMLVEVRVRALDLVPWFDRGEVLSVSDQTG